MNTDPPELGMVEVETFHERTRDDPAWVHLRHERFPGMRFVLVFADTGELASFQVDRQPDGEPGPPLTRNLVKRVPIGELERAARQHLRWWRSSYLEGRSPALTAHEAEMKRYNEALRRIGREDLAEDPYIGSSVSRMADTFAQHETRRATTRSAVRSERWYAELAARYVELCGSGDQAPIRTLAVELRFAESTIRNALSKARREMQLLTAVEKGQRGGDLTPKAIAILEQGD